MESIQIVMVECFDMVNVIISQQCHFKIDNVFYVFDNKNLAPLVDVQDES